MTALTAAACGGTAGEPPSGCVCDAAQGVAESWCEACGIGHVAGFRIESRMLFEALDAHGHDLDPRVMTCTTCVRLMDTGGFCESCRFGWVDQQAYMSRLTYQLALGAVRDPQTVRCLDGDTHAGEAGWCEACGEGRTGNRWFTDRSAYEAARHEVERLRRAVAAAPRCGLCALVILVDGTCPACRIVYRDGVPLEPARRPPSGG